MKIFKSQKGQKGITGLETAIILIAFVIVAAVFAYTAFAKGIFSERENFVITDEFLGVGDGAKTRFALNYPLGTVDVSNLGVFLDGVKTDRYSYRTDVIVFDVAPNGVKITVNYTGQRVKKK